MNKMYRNNIDGLCGNDDCGQMSAWYILSSMGFYPVCPGTDQYILGSPLFKSVTLNLENGKKVGADSWQQRVKNQTPHCGFGEAGTCCRICSMGPCRITPKAPRGICGCDVHGIVGRNYLRFTAGGAATHSDHGRQICHTLYQAKEGGSYQVKDPEKLKKIAAEWGIETEGKDIYCLLYTSDAADE